MKEIELKIKIDWCIEQHHRTNHFYDQYLPYEFHLRMVAQAAKDFKRLLDPVSYYHPQQKLQIEHTIILACYGHDLIEDTRVSYNDVKEILGVEAADIVYAVSNEKGKNRKERANDKYYEGIRNIPGAVFVKLCDRIANVQYSKMTKSRMFEMYKKENEEFGKQLGVWSVPGYTEHEFFPLFAYLLDLFEEK